MKWLNNSNISAILIQCVLIYNSVHATDRQCNTGKAERAISNQQYHDAIRVLSTCDNSPQVHAIRGTAYYNLYMADSAIGNFLEAVPAGQNGDDILVKVAHAFLWKKDFLNATKYIQQVIDTERLDYRSVLARKYQLVGDYDKSLAVFDGILATHPNHYPSMLKKAAVLSWIKKFDESVSLYTDIIDDSRASESIRMKARTNRAEVLSWQKNFTQALKELDHVIRKDAKNIDARLLQAQINEWKGNYKMAKMIYNDVLQIDPKNKQAQIRLEKLLWVK